MPGEYFCTHIFAHKPFQCISLIYILEVLFSITGKAELQNNSDTEGEENQEKSTDEKAGTVKIM